MVFSSPNKIIESNLNHNIIINNKIISRVSQTKFLGIIIDEHLTWHPHITLVKNKVAKIIGIVKKLKYTLPSKTLKTLYNSLILPHLSNGNLSSVNASTATSMCLWAISSERIA